MSLGCWPFATLLSRKLQASTCGFTASNVASLPVFDKTTLAGT
jgi:hypothetical protein